MKRTYLKFSHFRFAVSFFLALCLVVLPQYVATAGDAPNGVQVQVKTYRIMEPLPGQPVVLPDEMPAECRAQVLEAISTIPPCGDPVVIAPQGVPAEYRSLVDTAIADATSSGGVAAPALFDACVGWIVLIIVIIVVAVIIYVLWKICQMIPPPKNGSPGGYGNPSFASRPSIPAHAETASPAGLRLYNMSDPVSPGYTHTGTPYQLQGCLDIGSPEWFPLCTFQLGQVYENTNAAPGSQYATLSVIGTNGDVIAQSLVIGMTNGMPNSATNGTVLRQQDAAPIAIPAPTSDRMFFRLVPQR